MKLTRPHACALLFGLLAACAWGTGDFTGGLASRRAPEAAVILATEGIGLVLLLGFAVFMAIQGWHPSPKRERGAEAPPAAVQQISGGTAPKPR